MNCSWPRRCPTPLLDFARPATLAVLLLANLAMPSPGIADPREPVALSAAERARLLQGMRVYLLTIQEIVEAAAIYKLDHIGDAARRAGAAMLADVEPATALKLPLAFMALSLETHQKFDELADGAKRHMPRSEVLAALGGIIARCNGCHESYRLDMPP